MPELSNIQTFIELKDKDYSSALEPFKQVLINLEAWNEQTERAFKNPDWRDEDGFVFSELMNLEERTTKYSGIRIRPLVHVWTPKVDPTLRSNWISCDLLIESDELIDNYSTGQFREYTFDFVEHLAFEMTNNLGTPTYFTNEADDGEPFDGLRTANQNELWSFDYALIPVELSNLYSTPPDTHQIRMNGQFLECWKTELWRSKNTDNIG